MKLSILFLPICLLFLIVVPICHALQIDVDQVIWQPDDGFDGSALSAAIIFREITDDTNSFEIVLTNTSGNLTPTEDGFPSSVLLTGLGFNLPSSFKIADGSILEVGTGDVFSQYWGYDNDPLDSGPFLPYPEGYTTLSVNTVISTMESSTEPSSVFDSALFAADPAYKPKFKGPDYGILNQDEDVPDNYPHIFSEALITVDLSGTVTDWDTFFSGINNNAVVVSFGSPTAVAPIPEPATMLLLGTGLIGLGWFGKRKKESK